jgi:hypothetical protein
MISEPDQWWLLDNKTQVKSTLPHVSLANLERHGNKYVQYGGLKLKEFRSKWGGITLG